MTHAFLSNEWIDAARGIREKYSDQVPEIPTAIKINLAILEVPFDENTVNAFFDTSSGGLRLELGELDDADATITTDYETAQSLFVEQDQTIASRIFYSCFFSCWKTARV